MRIVLKIGGSILYADKGTIAIEVIKKYVDIIRKLVKQEHQLGIVVGGGKAARMYISAVRELGASESICDDFGIQAARLNAKVLAEALGDLAYPKIATTVEELEQYATSGRIVLMGGLTPGHSTNAVAAIMAETLKAEMLLNATNIDGVYDRPPEEQGAQKYDEISGEEFEKLMEKSGSKAGSYELFDMVAVDIIRRSHIKTIIFDGTEPENILKIIAGKKVGTIINA